MHCPSASSFFVFFSVLTYTVFPAKATVVDGPLQAPGSSAPLILLPSSVLYILFACLHRMLPHLFYFLQFSLLVFFFENRRAPFPVWRSQMVTKPGLFSCFSLLYVGMYCIGIFSIWTELDRRICRPTGIYRLPYVADIGIRPA